MTKDQAPKAPKIEFPLDYPIKVIGTNEQDFEVQVSEVIERFDQGFDRKSIVKVASRKATFVSLRFSIWATGKDQLAGMHQELMKLSCVKMVL
ncbi:MAG: hypothetical protein C9356_16090 [Oleiphilus sp.]|nr:MAG: hypothetical protein C9356_16090 [Oleiphilus sp.]